MTGTTKSARRPNVAAAKKAATREPARGKAVKVAKPAPAPKPKAPAVPETVALEAVAELTAADLANSGQAIAEPAAGEAQPEHIKEPVVAQMESVPSETPSMEGGEETELKGNEIMADVMETTKKYAEDAKEKFQSAFAEMSEKAKTGVEKSTKAFEEFSDLAKGNVEAFVESGKIATKGVESIGQDAAEYGRMTFEKASAAMKSLAAVKSPTEFFQLQSELLSSTFDAFAKETAKNSEALLKLAGEVAQPISTRVSVVTEKVRSLAA